MESGASLLFPCGIVRGVDPRGDGVLRVLDLFFGRKEETGSVSVLGFSGLGSLLPVGELVIGD